MLTLKKIIRNNQKLGGVVVVGNCPAFNANFSSLQVVGKVNKIITVT